MTKKKMAWITDSTAYITKELLDNPNVYVVPLGIIFGNDAFEDGIDLTTTELYQCIRSEKQIPKTSQPSLGKFTQLFKNLSKEYDCAIAIHVSGKLSGTLDCCKTASAMTEFQVEVVDSKSMSYAITTLLYKGMELAEQGLALKDIAIKLGKEANKSENYILLGSLEQFYKGGRMSGTQYLLGSILHIKPMIRINPQGEFELFETIRSEKKAMKRMLELLDNAFQQYNITSVQIMHGNVAAKARELEINLTNKYPGVRIIVGEISSAIAVHAGEGTLAIIWSNEPK